MSKTEKKEKTAEMPAIFSEVIQPVKLSLVIIIMVSVI